LATLLKTQKSVKQKRNFPSAGFAQDICHGCLAATSLGSSLPPACAN